MRLVCPNCGAHYEVDDRVIPDSGRDVQCSSCGHGWYQMPASIDAAEQPAPIETEEAIGSDDDSVDLEPEVEPDETREAAADGVAEPGAPIDEGSGEPAATAPEEVAPEPVADAAKPETAPESVTEEGDEANVADATEPTDAEGAEEDDAEVTTGAEGADAPKRALDDNLRAILQEEMAREMAARAADTAPETAEAKPDLGPAETPTDSGTQPAPDLEPAKAFDDDELPDICPAPQSERGADVFAAPAAAAGAMDKASRKDLFPDIEEINSTLDSHGPDDDYEEETVPERRGGFGRGFFAVIFIAALAFALYLVAPKLAESVPALEPALSGYVSAVNGARGWIEGLMQGVTDQIDSAE